MKKLLLIVSVLLFSVPSFAQTWYTANQVTIGWDAVAKVETTDTIKYQVYLRNDLVSTGTKYGAEITATQLLVSLTTEGEWLFGVETVRYKSGVTEPVRSSKKAWSNVAEDCAAAGPFGVRFFIVPGSPGGLKLIQP